MIVWRTTFIQFVSTSCDVWSTPGATQSLFLQIISVEQEWKAFEEYQKVTGQEVVEDLWQWVLSPYSPAVRILRMPNAPRVGLCGVGGGGPVH